MKALVRRQTTSTGGAAVGETRYGYDCRRSLLRWSRKQR